MDGHTRIGCEAYIVRRGKLLLIKRGNGVGKGSWSLPGGHLEYMERLDQGIIRELKEELNLEVKPNDLTAMAITDDIRPEYGQHYIHITFKVRIGSQEPVCREPERCAAIEWFPLDALPKDIFPFQAKVFATIETRNLYTTAG